MSRLARVTCLLFAKPSKLPFWIAKYNEKLAALHQRAEYVVWSQHLHVSLTAHESFWQFFFFQSCDSSSEMREPSHQMLTFKEGFWSFPISDAEAMTQECKWICWSQWHSSDIQSSEEFHEGHWKVTYYRDLLIVVNRKGWICFYFEGLLFLKLFF